MLKAQNADENDLDTGDVTINMGDNSQFMSDFFTQVDSLRTNIDKISELVDEVKRLHSTILAAPQADDRTKEELEDKMNEIKKRANDVRQRLKSECSDRPGWNRSRSDFFSHGNGIRAGGER